MPYTPRWYTLLHAGNPNDVTFYLDACQNAASVLELGAGIGRISIPLAAAGLSVTAIDNSKESLKIMRQAAERLPSTHRANLRIVDGDMRDFSFRDSFERILIPYNSLLCLLSEADVLKCLRCASRHLSEQGQLIFDMYDVPMGEVEEGTNDDDGYEYICKLVDGALSAHVYEKSLRGSDSRRFDVRYKYDITDAADKPVESFTYDIAQRCIYKEELHHLLGEAGLRLCALNGDFENEPVTEDSYQVVVTAERL